MKYLRKILFVMLLLMPLLFTTTLVSSDSTEEPIKKADGSGDVTYIGTNITVTIPKEFIRPEAAFRAVWVSAFTNDIAGFGNEDQYKREIMDMLDVCEYYNMNAVIFHVRVYNDAFYQSKYCKWSRYYSTNPTWDALPWVIEECHRRGIEFHAWLNPYRVSTANNNLNEVAKRFQSNNAASNPDNLLAGDSTVILNPGIPEVRDFLVRVCMELIENYDVDAINFDDYFYVSADDSATQAKYKPPGQSTADWRRDQVSMFIHALSDEMRAFNQRTGRRVQLGIAPSGIWKSGSGIVTYDDKGNAITNGSSTTSSYSHYGGNLYADTLKWINEEWIDYILPQTYWAIEHGSAGYPDLCDWWDKVVKYKNVNFYSALGLYLSTNTGGSSWYTSNLEGYNQIMYANKLENCRGTSVYTFANLRSKITNPKSFYRVTEVWNKPSILPEIRTMDRITPSEINGVNVGITDAGYKISFSQADNTKFYVIYRSEDEITYSPEEVIDIIGGSGHDGIFDFIDITSDTSKKYNYAIRTQSNSLTLSSGYKFNTTGAKETTKASLDKVDGIVTSSNTFENETIEIRWNKVYYSYGDKIDYELEYSFDETNWETSTNAINQNDGFGRCTTNLTIPNGKKTLYLRVYASNNLAESTSEVKEVKIDTSYGKINHFTCLGELYTGREVEFVWNNQLEYNNVKFTLQVSTDNFTYSDVATTLQKGTDVTNTKLKITLPSENGRYYYRVKGEHSGMVSYSDIYIVEIKDYFGNITGFLINNEAPREYYIASEDDVFTIEFDKKESETYNISYISRISKDNNTVLTPSALSNKNRSYVSGGKGYQEIYMTGTEYKYYYYLEVSMEGKINKTDTVMFYCMPEDMFFDEFTHFMMHEQNYYIGELGIFN